MTIRSILVENMRIIIEDSMQKTKAILHRDEL